MAADPEQTSPLDHSLERLEEALARSRASEALTPPTSAAGLAPNQSTAGLARQIGVPMLAALLVVLLWMGATAGYLFLVPAVCVGLGLVALLTRRKATSATALTSGSKGPRVQMGASVASDVVLREGSVVAMGASVGAGAVLERGAVVRAGASIGPRAVLEEGASVSWGASVGEGAVIGAGAVIAAGSDVAAGARVPAGAYLAAGTSWTAALSDGCAFPPAQIPHENETASDPRAEQIKKACDRLEEEYARAPEPVRAMFGEARKTLSGLRRPCLDLIARERALRAEASPEALARLDQEKAAIEARLVQANDEQVRRSLSRAVTAIAAQQKQLELLQNYAERLSAELTRLLWTVEGMGTELVRVRAAGTDLHHGSAAEITQSVEQLRDEIDNIAQALEEANQGAHLT